MLLRRDFLTLSLLTAFAREADAAVCLMKESEISVENSDSPFFEHFHQLEIPVAALFAPSSSGVAIQTSLIDLESYDVAGMKKFVAEFGLEERALLKHRHTVQISKSQLERIAAGVRNVEIRVISPNGNYVHNYLITASPSALVKVRKHRATQQENI